eukprot:CAMPEP_0179277454 /NCGR_PEP_ID=MMETSP0797-20121207/35102_1 /TAXON_ID=47934 /ORGANISM="Dinophysis acuminata, Strain DAEP01" /LENGTH=350 /DNA_ID=CAMNT_0020986043 /DNA_START=12 /DNA_END=1061 /DNA_ORIENTATION=+
MQAAFNATLPSGRERMTFSGDDLVSLRVADGLIGDRLNWPFGSAELIRYSREPVFSKGECAAVVEEAESYAAKSGGWGTKRHYSHPTTDVTLQELPRSYEWFKRVVPTHLFPMIASCFPNVAPDPEKLRIFDVFVVKYDSARQSYLGVHRDSSLISITVALNPVEEYEGGGMWVEPLDRVVQLDRGQVVAFASNVRHGGHRITGGYRYILVGFLLYEDYVEHDRRLLETSQALRARGDAGLPAEACRQALGVNPRRQEAWNNLGVLQQDAGDYAAAIESFESALAIEPPSYQEGWVNLGVCQGLAGNAAASLKTARHAVGLNANDATAQYNLGCALGRQGGPDEALRCFD